MDYSKIYIFSWTDDCSKITYLKKKVFSKVPLSLINNSTFEFYEEKVTRVI